jgi:predicted Zn-dependent protease
MHGMSFTAAPPGHHRAALRLPLLPLLVLVAGCATNPATGQRQLMMVSESQEVSMGQEYAKQIGTEMPPVANEPLQRYVREIGTALAARSERPQLPWSFTVVDDPVVNAFALPGGPIYVSRGILAHFNSEAELAAVLGHEIGHVTGRHSANQMSKQQLYGGLLVGAAIFNQTVAQNAELFQQGMGLLFLKYGRDQETQADELGFRYMARGGYDQRQMAEVFRMLDRTSPSSAEGRPPQWLSTHPDPGNRFEATERRLARGRDSTATRIDRERYLRMLDGLVVGENPREGVFVGGARFVHPDLAFEFTFPTGWRTQNSKQAVAAQEPQGRALMVFTLAQGTPDQAARAFAGQQGIAARDLSVQAGGPSRAVLFQATTAQGQVEGIAAFVAMGSATYRLLCYGGQGVLQALEAPCRRWIASLAPLRDAQLLAVQPALLRLITTPRAMTVEEVQREFPSSLPFEQWLVLNNLQAGQSVPRGTLLKRVVGGVSPGR